LTYDNEKSGKREVFIAQSAENMNRWGTLQYYESMSGDSKTDVSAIRTAAKIKVDTLLTLYNSKTRSCLKIT
jgi:hypothetical protein